MDLALPASLSSENHERPKSLCAAFIFFSNPFWERLSKLTNIFEKALNHLTRIPALHDVSWLLMRNV